MRKQAIRVMGAVTLLGGIGVNPATASVWELNVKASPTGTIHYFGTQEDCQTAGGILDNPVCLGTYTEQKKFPFSFQYQFDESKGQTQDFIATLDLNNFRWANVNGTISFVNGKFLGTDFQFFGDTGIGTIFLPDFGVNAYAYVMGSAPKFSVSYRSTDMGTPPVPEPTTWALLLVGFLGVGAVYRRTHVVRASRIIA